MTIDKTTRVIYVGSPELFSKGASAIHIMKMCQAMTRLGIETELIIPANRKRSQLFEYYGVKSEFRLTSFPYFSNTSIRNIVHGLLSAFYIKFYRADKYDVVVTRNIVFTYFATKFFQIPTIYDAHHPLVKGGAFLFDSFKNSKYLVRFSTNSKGLSDIYLDLGLPKDKLVVAHNGVELERFQDLPSKTKCREILDLPLEKKIVCYAGNIYEGRGIEHLIDVAPRFEDAMFLIVGGLDEDVDRNRHIAESKGVQNIKFVGFVNHVDVPFYLKSSDILVMPYTTSMTIKGGTKAEQFTSPIKLFEYMAAAKPIVATSIPSVKEILQDSVNSILVDPDSGQAIRDGLEKVLSNDTLSEKIAAKAGREIQKYTWEERVKKLLNL